VYRLGKLKEKPVGPGIRLLWGLGGIYQSAIVMNTTTRVDKYKPKNLISGDGVEFEGVDYSAYWRIDNPAKLLKETEVYKNIIHEVTESRLRDAVGSIPFREVNGLSLEDIMGGEPGSEYLEINEEYKLSDMGLKVEKLLIGNTYLPEHMEKLLAQEAIAEAEAAGKIALAKAKAKEIREIADAEFYAATQTAAIAEMYAQNPNAMKLAELEMHKAYAEGPNNTSHIISDSLLKGVSDGLSDILGKKLLDGPKK